MKGYFSKLAKQSGLRHAQTSANPRSRSEKSFENAPLDREETILAAPENARTEAAQNVQNFVPPIETPSNKKTFADNQINAEPIRVNASETTEKQIAAPFEEQIFQAESLPFESNVKSSSDQNFSSGEITKADDSLTIEQVVFKDTEKVSAVEIFENNESLKGEVVEAKPIQTEYFQKTSELIESGTASPLEIQQILLREVRQWVSDSPTAESIEQAENVSEKRDEVRAIIAPIEQKAVVMSETLKESVAENAEKLQEQNFSLSIGNISITVEEPENKLQTEVVSQNRTTAANQTEKRPYSRLSRYYL
jgi:hypothetical protein